MSTFSKFQLWWAIWIVNMLRTPEQELKKAHFEWVFEFWTFQYFYYGLWRIVTNIGAKASIEWLVYKYLNPSLRHHLSRRKPSLDKLGFRDKEKYLGYQDRGKRGRWPWGKIEWSTCFRLNLHLLQNCFLTFLAFYLCHQCWENAAIFVGLKESCCKSWVLHFHSLRFAGIFLSSWQLLQVEKSFNISFLLDSF